MRALQDHIADWNTVSLAELEAVSLYRRIDTKFVLPPEQLYLLLERLKEDHKVLEINGNRIFKYKTVYFDTPDFQFYKDHHNGYLNRVKVRYREYVDSGQVFYEIKRKLPGDQTHKTRMLTDRMQCSLTSDQYDLIDYQRLDNRPMEMKIVNQFHRMTLTHMNMQERITIDTDIRFDVEGKNAILPDIAILELKQSRYDVASPIVRMLKKMRIYPSSFSKYVTGVAMLNLHQKQNNFKSQLLKIGQFYPSFSEV